MVAVRFHDVQCQYHPDLIGIHSAAAQRQVRFTGFSGSPAAAPGYGPFEQKTGREIPVVRLNPER
jgi:hypothetical protein